MAAPTGPSARIRSARPPLTRVRAYPSRYGAAVSSTPYRRSRPVETVAGFLAAASIFVSLAGVAYRPLRLVPFAILLALIAVGIGGRSERDSWKFIHGRMTDRLHNRIGGARFFVRTGERNSPSSFRRWAEQIFTSRSTSIVFARRRR